MVVHGCPMVILSQKLKLMKNAFKIWKNEIFGDVHKMVATAYYELDSLQQHIDKVTYSEDLHERELIALKNLSTWLIF